MLNLDPPLFRSHHGRRGYYRARQTRAYHDMDVVQYDSECLRDRL
jgi:hypothetical protein